MSLLECLCGQLHSKRVVIIRILRELAFIRKILWILCDCVFFVYDNKDAGSKRAFSTYFTFLLKGKNAYLTRKKLCEVYGEDVLTVKKLVFKISFLSTLKMGHVLKD